MTTYGKVVYRETATSGTVYRVREVVGEGTYAITVGRAPDLAEMGRLDASQLPDASTYVDAVDEEMRCLIENAREEFGR